jgi:hypothetical protein
MSNKGRMIDVDEYLASHPDNRFGSHMERGKFERSAISQFKYASQMLDLAMQLVPRSLKDSLRINFTSEPRVAAQVTGTSPHFTIDVSMGLIESAWRASESLHGDDDLKRSMERLILAIVVGHELTHAFSGHNEGDPSPKEGRSVESHADFFSGLYVSRLSYGDKPEVSPVNLGKSVWITLAALILATMLDHDACDDYHSSSVRFLFIIAGHIHWLECESPSLRMQASQCHSLQIVTKAVNMVVLDPKLRSDMLRSVELALSSDENVFNTIATAKSFQGQWYRRAALLEPIRDQLDLGPTPP